MKKYIESEKAYEIARTSSCFSDFHRSRADLTSLRELFEVVPNSDVVEVIRCVDCGYWSGYEFGNVCRRLSRLNTEIRTKSVDFCSYGIKKAGDTK